MISLSSRLVFKHYIRTSRISNGPICAHWKLENSLFQNCSLLFGSNSYFCYNQVSFLTTEPSAMENLLLNPQVASIIDTTHKLGFNECEVLTVLKNKPDLLKIPSNLWNTTVSILLDHGFRENDILLIIEKSPKVLQLKESNMIKNLTTWLKCDLGTELVSDLIAEHPSFLLVNHNQISMRIKQYQNIFESKKRVGKLLMLAPNLLEESWSIIIDKLNYLNELCTERSDIAASGVLAHSLLHIKARHEFLIRSGLYKRPKKDFRKRLSKNPTLLTIVNPNDDYFVTNVARTTMFEYQVFLEMFERELKTIDRDNELDEDENLEQAYNKSKLSK